MKPSQPKAGARLASKRMYLALYRWYERPSYMNFAS